MDTRRWILLEITFLFLGLSLGLNGLNPPAENSFLWRIDSDPPSYFFGTIHVPYTRVWNFIPATTKEAFRRSDTVYFELDLTSPKTLSALSACQLLPGGLHLSQVVPSDLFLRLKLHLEYVRNTMPEWITQDQIERGIDADYLFTAITGNWERKRPIWVTFMINSLTRGDIASRGFPVLDLYLSTLASKSRKKIGAIEKVEEQCRPLNLLNDTQVIFALNQTLKRQEDLRYGISSHKRHYNTDDLIKSYKSGDLDQVIFSQDTILLPNLPTQSDAYDDAGLSEGQRKMAEDIDAFFRENMINLRNKRMAARVIDLLWSKPGKSYFFAFGAGHFMGNKSVLDYVQSAGYSIHHVKPNESLDNFPHNKNKHGGGGGLSHKSYTNKNGKNLVAGTFEDLSENEKTRALLQFLQYHQQLEQEEETKRFQELLKQRGVFNSDLRNNKDDEKTLEKSLRIWYGLENKIRRSKYAHNQGSKNFYTGLPIFLILLILKFIY